MDDINRQIEGALRAQALRDQALHEAEQSARTGPTREIHHRPPPAGTGPLVLERRRGDWQYTLLGRRVRVGVAIELYVDPRLGWIRGRFHWGRRNTSEPRLRLPAFHPDDPGQDLGEIEIALPEAAICRWPPEDAHLDEDPAEKPEAP
jgi:hypothetical protein